MKCPKCGNQHKRKEGATCSCGYAFVFDPSTDAKMTDGKFAALIRLVSRDNTAYFTENQLYATYCRTFVKGRRGRRVVGCVGAILAAIAFLALFFGLAPIAAGDRYGLELFALLVGVVFLIVYLTGRGKKPAVDREQFRRFIQRWHQGGNDLGKLLTRPSLTEPPPEWREPDIYDYGVERILLVERDILVDLLVRNGFHAEEKALVLSIRGYPGYLVPVMKTILERAPETPIFYLHDAPAEKNAPYGLRKAQALVDGRPITDLGFFHEDVKRMDGLKDLPASAWKDRLPADTLNFTGLSGILAASLVAGLAFDQVLAQQRTDADGSGGYG